ncbi:MAG: hypothetical protein LE180_04085 [Endomicrobium sp.]|nr:hypothetical protein [Endomicrobium sp.]
MASAFSSRKLMLRAYKEAVGVCGENI